MNKEPNDNDKGSEAKESMRKDKNEKAEAAPMGRHDQLHAAMIAAHKNTMKGKC